VAQLAAQGVHEPHERPFLRPWAEGSPEARARFDLGSAKADTLAPGALSLEVSTSCATEPGQCSAPSHP